MELLDSLQLMVESPRVEWTSFAPQAKGRPHVRMRESTIHLLLLLSCRADAEWHSLGPGTDAVVICVPVHDLIAGSWFEAKFDQSRGTAAIARARATRRDLHHGDHGGHRDREEGRPVAMRAL